MDTSPIGQAILERIAVREKAKLQAHFLERLTTHPESANFVLCGSAALHGIYLHGRWSKDIDFAALPDIVDRFPAIALECGLKLELKIDNMPTLDRTPYTFALPRATYPDAAIAVEIFTHPHFFVPPVREAWTSDTGETVLVQSKPLYELVATKLGCLVRRVKAVDYLDVWLGLKSNPELRYSVRDLMRQKLCFAGDFTPPTDIDPDHIISQLDELRDKWHEKSRPYIKHVPSFDTVRDDLARWLPFFADSTK